MLNAPQKQETVIDRVLTTFFHLPTLLVLTVVSVMFVWQLYGLSVTLGETFIRLDSNRGKVLLHWQNGSCDVEW